MTFYCELCLKHGIKVFNLHKDLQVVNKPSKFKWMLIDTVAELYKNQVNQNLIGWPSLI